MKRAALITGLTLVTVVVLAVAGVYGVLGTQAGSRWALGLVPGLQLDNFNGHLAGRWSADHLLWQQGDTRVEVDAPVFDWSPGCLLRMTLCIEQLHADQVRLHFAPSAEEKSSGPITLPNLKLPVAIELGDVRVGSLLLDGAEQLRDLQLAAHWTAAGMQIDSVHVQRDELVLDLSGLLQPTGDWPIKAQGQLKLPSQDDQAWTLALHVQGDLLKTLQLDADSSGYLNAKLTGQLQALAENLPAQIKNHDGSVQGQRGPAGHPATQCAGTDCPGRSSERLPDRWRGEPASRAGPRGTGAARSCRCQGGGHRRT